MSVTVLERTNDYLRSFGLLNGYQTKYFTWSDTDLNESAPFVLFRKDGPGQSDVFLQRIPMLIILCSTPELVLDLDSDVTNIAKQFRKTDPTINGVIKFEVTSEPIGPMYTSNGRPLYEMTVTAFVEDQ